MLPRESRLRTAADFAAVIKAGRRAGTQRLVVHALLTNEPAAPRAGFVVSGKVGNSVVRHRITRRLRPLVRQQLSSLPPGTAIVVRALPTAASANSAELGVDLQSGVAAAVRKAASPAGSRGAGRPAGGRSGAARSVTAEGTPPVTAVKKGAR